MSEIMMKLIDWHKWEIDSYSSYNACKLHVQLWSHLYCQADNLEPKVEKKCVGLLKAYTTIVCEILIDTHAIWWGCYLMEIAKYCWFLFGKKMKTFFTKEVVVNDALKTLHKRTAQWALWMWQHCQSASWTKFFGFSITLTYFELTLYKLQAFGGFTFPVRMCIPGEVTSSLPVRHILIPSEDVHSQWG